MPTPVVTLLKVKTPSGQQIEVMGKAEQSFYQGQRDKYQAENKFTNNSDLLDLDRLLFLELMIYRATSLIGRGKNYYDELLTPGEEADARKSLKENSALISTIKNDLGLTKSQRDKAQYESVGTYITELKRRAREFGIHREKQLTKALVLMNQLSAVIGSFDRSDEVERDKIGYRDEAEIVDWIRDQMLPEFRQVDAYFRANAQKTWVRDI